MEALLAEDVVKKVEFALQTIRPFLNEDGGDIELLEVTKDFTVKVKFKGACTDCSMSNMTFNAGVKEAILNNVPEVKKVVAITD